MSSDNLASVASEDLGNFFLLALSISLKENWGPAANVALYSSGKELGKSFGSKFRGAGSLEEAIESAKRALGGAWNVKLDGNRLISDKCFLKELYERGGFSPKEPLPTCYFLLGFCAGILEEALGKKVNMRVDSYGASSCIELVIMEE